MEAVVFVLTVLAELRVLTVLSFELPCDGLSLRNNDVEVEQR